MRAVQILDKPYAEIGSAVDKLVLQQWSSALVFVAKRSMVTSRIWRSYLPQGSGMVPLGVMVSKEVQWC